MNPASPAISYHIIYRGCSLHLNCVAEPFSSVVYRICVMCTHQYIAPLFGESPTMISNIVIFFNYMHIIYSNPYLWNFLSIVLTYLLWTVSR